MNGKNCKPNKTVIIYSLVDNIEMIRVGRCKYDGGKRIDPSYQGFTTIVVLMKGHNKWGCLGPYELKDDKGRIMENIWQFSKVYEEIPKTIQHYSRWDKTVIWSYPEEKHIIEDKIQECYWKWRELGMNNSYAVRYPVGFGNMRLCKFALWGDERLDYITARIKIYVPLYISLVKKIKEFLELKKRVEKGDKLLIVEVDGPHEESMEYYKSEWGVGSNFIELDTMLATEENLTVMLNDPIHPFGHGYCLAMALQNMTCTLV